MWTHLCTSNEIKRAIESQCSDHWENALPLQALDASSQTQKKKKKERRRRRRKKDQVHRMVSPSYLRLSNATHTTVYSMELLIIAFLPEWKKRDNLELCRGSRGWLSGRCRKPSPVTPDVLSASNCNKKWLLTNFLSRETLLLITISLSCNEVQVFKDGLEKCSQLIKVCFAPECFLFFYFCLPAQGYMSL